MDPDLDDTLSPARRTALGALEDLDDTVVSARAVPDGLASDGLASDGPLPDSSMHDTAPVDGPPPAVEPLAPSYGFRVGYSGRTVLLDVAAYVGRSPGSPRIQNGVLPKLIRVSSPNGEVSSTHIELRQLGSSIIVTDLRSTNGSTVSVPGSAPRSLRQGESMVVTPGTLVDIGDGNIIEILPLQRRLGGYAS